MEAAFANDLEKSYEDQRSQLIDTLKSTGINDACVLGAMRRVPRHLFIPEENQALAYINRPLGIGYKQTISQPYIVAYMTQALHVQEGDKILEIGTGSGYQAAILAELGATVYTIEIVDQLAKRSAKLLKKLDYADIHVRSGDGYKGWPGHAPFDKIILTAAPPSVPNALLKQLKIGGKLIAPIGEDTNSQVLIMITRLNQTHYKKETLLNVRFVPMIEG
jgi:protein-L-isoaspartate(D-aspartate) O-methyltransferase